MLIIRRKKGFTLIEVVITVALVGLLGSLVSMFFLQIYKSYSKADAKMKVTQVAITTLGNIQKQIREISVAPTCATNTTLHPTSANPISFYIPSLTDPTNRASDDRIDYYLGTYNGKNILLQRLVRGTTTYNAIPITFNFDTYRKAPTTIPAGGGIAAFLNDPTLRFDDAAFFYDIAYTDNGHTDIVWYTDNTFDEIAFTTITFGVTVSVADRGRSGYREKLTLSSTVSIRNSF